MAAVPCWRRWRGAAWRARMSVLCGAGGDRQGAGTLCCRRHRTCDAVCSPPVRSTPMRALTVTPGKADSAGLEDVPEPPLSDGPVLVQTLAVGVCGTDLEIVSGKYGWAPPGKERLILGHESLGRVLESPAGS